MQCFVLSGKGAALLGLPDTQLLDLLSVKCIATDVAQRSKQINPQCTRAECNTNNNSKNNPTAKLIIL